ncbi:MAG TPA: SDR family oxidoreductase [Armatimonadota bacterium]|nr:SDR family oxidoreductase [Armatimonadota bacterium]HPP74117.1 SDR family oxidoreductase [Armatimonadota bacterium]
MHELKDKVVQITGAGRGIGRAIALAMAREGAKVAMAARTEREINTVAEEINLAGGTAIAIRTDLMSESDIKKMVYETEQAFGPIDILINNAGVLKLAPVTEISTSMWDELISVNLRAVFLACREVLPGMMERKSGRIINIGSMAGRRGYVEQGAYCAAKHGLIGLSKVMALETQRYGIRIHVLAPGGVLTGLSEELRASRGNENEDAWMTPEEVAQAALYLCTQNGAAMTDELVLRRYESEPWR